MKQLFVLLMMLVLVPTGHAGETQAEFSALAVQVMPGQKARQARMFVTPQFVRMEFENQGEQTIEITDLKAGRSLLLLPQKRLYTVRDAPEGVMQQMQQKQGGGNPCVYQVGAVCKKTGSETVFGRRTEKWEMTVEHQGKTYRSLYWVDSERHMPLRQQWADGTVSELRPVAEVELNARATEKWQMVTTPADGKVQTSTQWFDKELQMVIREELPGGYSRELRDIRVGKQDLKLFDLPEGYSPMPQARTSAQGQASGSHTPGVGR